MTHSLSDIRAAYLEFFKGKDHAIFPSSSLVPHNDPTLMFTNAGMVPFKNTFTGLETPAVPRATTAQKCVRAGGKHNDLDNVGYTARHHTFFEMMGNFSFGDYFKEKAISYAWEFLTGTLALPKDKLYVTVYHTDDEAASLWKKISGLKDERIIRIATNDNFWSMGETGPCGPCSEIYYNHADQPPKDITEAGDDCIEIWNLVFMQFEQKDANTRIALPKPSIDTGMGLERMAAVMQGVRDNYDVDLFKALIAAIQGFANISGEGPQGKAYFSARVIADHLRSSSFLIADGVMPSNEGRGYVLRRIMRRAMRHAHMLKVKEPLMYRLVPSLVMEMGAAYPELSRAQALITETLRLEEERFKELLDRGLKLLEAETGSLSKGGKLSGDVAFKLYDTYGFPLDLTQDILRGEGKSVDTEGFESAMEAQKAKARAAWKGSGGKATDEQWFDIKERVGSSEFVGYETDKATGKLLEIMPFQEKTALITNQTPFYGESGGQAGDKGEIRAGDAIFKVEDTIKKLGLHIHIGAYEKGAFEVGQAVDLKVDNGRRIGLRGHHSATHLLHAVLRRQLGEHVAQKGSLVEEDKLRFDFSHAKALTQAEINSIELEVNRLIRENSEVCTKLMAPEKAIEEGAMALFGEKYGEEVRVLSMGLGENSKNYSIELCGGTHVTRTGDIGLFKIVSESAVASGIRRIEAVVGEAALRHVAAQEIMLETLLSQLKSSPAEAVGRLQAVLEDRKRLEKELVQIRQKALSGGGQVQAQEKIGDVAFIGQITDAPAKDLKPMADQFKQQLKSGIVALISTSEGKISLVVGVTEDLTSRFDAVTLVKAGASEVGGKGGGGRPDLAQSGGVDAANANKALEAIKNLISGK